MVGMVECIYIIFLDKSKESQITIKGKWEVLDFW